MTAGRLDTARISMGRNPVFPATGTGMGRRRARRRRTIRRRARQEVAGANSADNLRWTRAVQIRRRRRGAEEIIDAELEGNRMPGLVLPCVQVTRLRG
jgi:hypothetical protein